MLGMSIGRLLDKDPGAMYVVVRLGYPAATCWVERVLFNKSAVNEVVAVVSNRKAHDKHVFVVIDVEKSFSSQSLAGCRCFIGIGHSPARHAHCIQFTENNPQVVVLPQTTDVYRVARLSSHLFAVYMSLGSGGACDIWDCNKLTGPLVRVTSDIRGPAEAEAGLVFSIEGNQLIVMEPLTRFIALNVTLPLRDQKYELGSPFCFH
ncbi:hypothetical protein Pelo_18399 [Pelomyxa schiedti]|nr:hypothetical protein Pelo_18399 [Pelomyxa schiedti]